jgi:hypothetical protein
MAQTRIYTAGFTVGWDGKQRKQIVEFFKENYPNVIRDTK